MNRTSPLSYTILVAVAATVLGVFWFRYSPPGGFIVWCAVVAALGRATYRIMRLRWPRGSLFTLIPVLVLAIFTLRDHYFVEAARGSALFIGVGVASVAVGAWAAELLLLCFFRLRHRDVQM
jgi:hypothetical protein